MYHIDMFEKKVRYNQITFTIKAPSKNPLKKYDVFQGKTFIVSFGQKYPNGVPYEQYKDKLGYYSQYDHDDKKRRDRYRQRHRGDYIDDPTRAGFWAYRNLW